MTYLTDNPVKDYERHHEANQSTCCCGRKPRLRVTCQDCEGAICFNCDRGDGYCDECRPVAEPVDD